MGTGWAQEQWGRGGDGDTTSGDGVEKGAETMGTVGDGASSCPHASL